MTTVVEDLVPEIVVEVSDIALKGDPGEQGIQGIAGPAVTLTVGSVTEVAPGLASASITGTSPDLFLNLELPVGITEENFTTALDSLTALVNGKATPSDIATAITALSLGTASQHDASYFARPSDVTNAVASEATARTSAISSAIGNLVNSAPGLLDTLGEIATRITDDETGVAAILVTVAAVQTALATKAPLASPALTGTPTAPTTTTSDNSAKLATTAFVKAVVSALSGDYRPLSTRVLATSNTAAAFGQTIAADTTGGTFTVTIPPASGGKGTVTVKWVVGTVAPTIALSGSDHLNTAGGSVSFAPSMLNQGYQLESDGTSIWTVVADDLPLNALDTRNANLYIGVTEAPLSPARYGAVGDGTTDDTTALQAAVSAAVRATNGEVRLSKAHKISNTLTVAGPMKISGAAGYETVLTQVTAGKAGFTLLKDTSAGEAFNRGLTLENLRVVGPGNGTSTAAGIDGNNSGDSIYQGQHLLLNNVTLHGWDIAVRLHHWDNVEVRASSVEYSRVGWWSSGNGNSMRLQIGGSNCTEAALRLGDGANVQLDLLDVISCAQILDLLDQSNASLRSGNFESCTGSQAFIHVANGARLTVSGAALRFLKNVGNDVPGLLVENGGIVVIDGPPSWAGFTTSKVIKKASNSATVYAVGPSRSLSVAPELLVDDNANMSYAASPWPVRQENAVPAAGVNLRNMLLAALTRDTSSAKDELFYYAADRSSGSTAYVQHVLTGWVQGTGDPAGVVAAPVGTRYIRLDAPDAAHAIYFKITGTGTSGWSAVAGATGATGPAGPASRKDLVLTAQGLISENYPRQLITGTTLPVVGTAYGMLLGLQAGDVVTNLHVFVGTAGAGTTPTLIRLALVDPSGVVQAITANDVASSRWTTAFTPATVALSTPYTIPAAGGYRIVFLQAGSWGTTAMTLGRAATLLANSQATPIGAGLREIGTYGGSLSDLPAVSASVAAGANINLPFWAAVS